MTEEDKALAVQFTKLSRIDSAAATQMLRWLRTNQDPNANYCLTCADAIRYLHARVCAVWEQYLLDNPEKKRNGKKNN
jgi:ABC-type transporter Mla MlaB component